MELKKQLEELRGVPGTYLFSSEQSMRDGAEEATGIELRGADPGPIHLWRRCVMELKKQLGLKTRDPLAHTSLLVQPIGSH